MQVNHPPRWGSPLIHDVTATDTRNIARGVCQIGSDVTTDEPRRERVAPSWPSISTGMGALTLRRATRDDCDLLWAWRNDPETRAQSHHSDPIPLDQHRVWLANALLNPARRLYIAIDNGVPIGTGRLDLTPEGGAMISITVAPDHRGRGYATPLVRALSAAVPHRPIDAEVKIHNARSCRTFERAGFHVLRRDDQLVTYRLPCGS